MERFIGLDAHVQSCTVAVMGPTGRRIKAHVVETQGRKSKSVPRAPVGSERKSVPQVRSQSTGWKRTSPFPEHRLEASAIEAPVTGREGQIATSSAARGV